MQHSLPSALQAVHFVVAAFATKAVPQVTLANPHVFAVQHSSPSALQEVHLVAAAFATKPAPHWTFADPHVSGQSRGKKG